MSALAATALSLAACGDAYWIAGEVKGGTSSGASGGATASGGSGTPTGGTGGASGQPACKPGDLGGADLCLDVAAWKQRAYTACADVGLVLGDYTPSDACGTDTFHFVNFTCCPQPPPPPQSECTTKVQGDGTFCQNAEAWKNYAYEDCKAAGGTLTGYSPSEDCGDGNSSSVKYTCCGITSPPPPPPPPQSQCTTKVQGDGTFCQNAEAWKNYAYEDCKAAGGTLTGYSPSEDCGDGNSRSVKYTCCFAPK